MPFPFKPKFILFKNVQLSDSAMQNTFAEQIKLCKNNVDWKVLKTTESFSIIEYLSTPQPKVFTIVIYDGDGSPVIVTHSDSDRIVLDELRDCLNDALG